MRLCEPIVLIATGKGDDRAVDGGLLDEQRLAAAGRFHFAVGQFGDFQFGGDGLGDAFEFAGAVELLNEIAEGIKSHNSTRLALQRNVVMRNDVDPGWEVNSWVWNFAYQGVDHVGKKKKGAQKERPSILC